MKVGKYLEGIRLKKTPKFYAIQVVIKLYLDICNKVTTIHLIPYSIWFDIIPWQIDTLLLRIDLVSNSLWSNLKE